MKKSSHTANPGQRGRLVISALFPVIIILAVYSCAGSRKSSVTKSAATSPAPTTVTTQAEQPAAPSETFTVVEEMPVFPGGEKALMEFLYKNIVYPAEAKQKNLQGRVIVRFVVNYLGKVENIEVIRGVDPLLDREAVRVISSLPDWKPGMQKGKPVNVYYTIPLTFALSSGISSQSPDYVVDKGDTIFLNPTEPASFPGGRSALTEYINKNFKGTAASGSFRGNITIAFNVMKDGSLTEFAVLGGCSPSADAEALRVAKMMPGWLPAKINGRPVSSRTSALFMSVPLTPLQTGKADPEEVFVVVEEMPQFPGGSEALMKYIYSNIRYPEKARQEGIGGRVILRFCITKTGQTDRVSVLRGVNPDLDEEAVRVIKSLPKWEPGKQGGIPVNVWYSVPITFQPLKPNEMPEKTEQPQQNPQVTSITNLYDAGYDEPPVFPGSEEALMRFIETNKNYPQAARDRNIKGTIVVRFRIDETGKVTNSSIFSGVDPLLDAEALRVVNSMPQWQPAKRKDKPVKVFYTLEIPFN